MTYILKCKGYYQKNSITEKKITDAYNQLSQELN